MAAQTQTLTNRFPQRILQADGVFELLLGAFLLVDANLIAGWLGVSAPIIMISGAGAMAMGAVLLYLAPRVSRQSLLVIGLLNIVGAALGVLILALDWNLFAMEGRWLMGIASDIFLTFGVVELFARRYTA